VETATPLLRELLDDPHYGQHAWRCAEAVRAEHGAMVTADLIEAQLSKRL
jgi:hypothetical protein